MSKVAIKGNASGTGTFTLEAPNSNTDRTLTLPDEAGTVLTSASDLTGLTGVPVIQTGDFNPYWADENNAPLFDTDPLSFDLTNSTWTNKWIRIGNQVFVTGYLLMPGSFGPTAAYVSGNGLQIGGLPFHSLGYHSLSCGYFAGWTGWSSGYNPMVISEDSTGNTGLTLRLSYAHTGGVTRVLQSTVFNSSSGIIVSGTYITGDA